MPTTKEILIALARPFPADAVSWRVGATNKTKDKGIALAYIDARDVQDRLDEVMGADWTTKHEVHAVAGKGGEQSLLVVCHLGLLLEAGGVRQWVYRSDGSGETDIEGEKGALSKALVRAGVAWGIGRYLYAIPSPWVEIESFGNSHRIKASEIPHLRRVAADALREFEKNPAHRPAAPEPEPGAPTAPAASSRPSAATPAGPDPGGAPAPDLLAAIRSAADMPGTMLALTKARSAGLPVAEVETAFVDRMIGIIEKSSGQASIEAIAGCLGRAQIARGSPADQRARAAMRVARDRLGVPA